MSPTRAIFAMLATLFVLAELVRPTHLVVPKRNAATGLLRPKIGYDPLLLADLPRMRPNARGSILIDRSRRPGSVTISGRIGEPVDGGRGAGVFAIIDGRRLASERVSYRSGSPGGPLGAFRITLTQLRDVRSSHFAVGLIRVDQRGYYLLEDPPEP